MLNKKLLQAVPTAMPYIRKNILFQWLAMLCTVICYGVLAWSAASLWETGTVEGLIWKVILFALALAGKRQFTIQAVRASAGASQSAKRTIRGRILEKLVRLSPADLVAWNTSELVQLSGEGAEQLEAYFANYVPQFLCASGAGHSLRHHTLSQCTGCHRPAGLRPADSREHRGRAEIRQETPGQILGPVYEPG